MARDLKAGDRLRVAGDAVTVELVEPATSQSVCHVDVAECRDIFVGPSKLLIHDFSVAQPVLAPFDRPVDLVSPRKDAK
jgi:hypothetical protein